MFTYCVSWPRLNKTGVVVASTNEVSTLNWSEQVHIAIISLASKEYVCSLHNMWKNGNIHSLLNSLSSVRVFFLSSTLLTLTFLRMLWSQSWGYCASSSKWNHSVSCWFWLLLLVWLPPEAIKMHTLCRSFWTVSFIVGARSCCCCIRIHSDKVLCESETK